MEHLSLIEVVPGKRGGKACIKGTRITVEDVLQWIDRGMSTKEILNDFPELTEQHISACICYSNQAKQHVKPVGE